MFKLLKTIFRVDDRPEWVKEEERELIKTLNESGDDLYVSPRGGIHRNPKSVKRGVMNESLKPVRNLERENEVLRDALVNIQGFLRNKGHSEDDPFVLGLINEALNWEENMK